MHRIIQGISESVLRRCSFTGYSPSSCIGALGATFALLHFICYIIIIIIMTRRYRYG